jgi:PAS domain S-box-containing protein
MRADAGVLLLSRDGQIVWANTAATILLGFSREELCRTTRAALGFPAAESSEAAEPARVVLTAGDGETAGYARLRCKSDRAITVRWKASALPESAAGRNVLLSFSEKAAVAPKPTATTGYRDVFEHAVEGFFRTSIDGQYLEANPALARMYGYGSPAELVKALRDLDTQLYVQPSRRTEFVRLMHEQGFVADFESEIYRADGSIIWIAEFGRVVRTDDGRPLYFEGSVIDITKRKRAEAARRKSEEKYRHLVEMTSVVPWEADFETGRFTYVGPQAVDFLGYPVEEWLEPGFWERIVHDDDRIWVTIVRAEGIEKRQKFECEYRLRRADGQLAWTREIVSVLPGEDGRPALGGFMLDVSYRRESEESLRESRHFIEQIAAASPTISYLYDPVRRQSIYVNGRVPDILGYTKEALSEMRPLFFLSLAHPDEVQAHEEHFDRMVVTAQNEVVEREFRLRNAVGGWVWLHSRECVFKQDATAEKLRIVGTIQDITLHRYTMDELEGNERLFRRLAETTGAVPFDFDRATGRFTYVGPQATSMFEYPLRNWYSADFWASFVHAEDLEAGTRFTRDDPSRADTDFQTEFRVHTGDERTIWVRQIVHRAAEADDRQHVRGFLFDVTEDKQAEEERERSRIQLRELAARGQQIREEERMSISREIHDELGQALTLFKLDLAWLATRVAKTVPEEAGEALNEKIRSMEEAVNSTLQIIRRILTNLRPPLLDELGLREAIEWQMEEFSKRVGIRYEVDATPVTSLPIASATAVFRIFQEILTNAARHAKASRIKVHLRESASDLLMRVEDNGVGISEDALRATSKFGLLGMRERAWSLGGEVDIHGAPGKGTTVTLRIPLRAKPAQKIAPASETLRVREMRKPDQRPGSSR